MSHTDMPYGSSRFVLTIVLAGIVSNKPNQTSWSNAAIAGKTNAIIGQFHCLVVKHKHVIVTL